MNALSGSNSLLEINGSYLYIEEAVYARWPLPYLLACVGTQSCRIHPVTLLATTAFVDVLLSKQTLSQSTAIVKTN